KDCLPKYDANGNLLQKTYFRSAAVTYTYDELNRLKQKNYDDGTPTETFGYDGKMADAPDG
ncbi:MAG: RHS repeat domain-containing protein, partial [Novosphingobium sp.]